MASEVLIKKSKVIPPPNTSCPKTWQIALILCFVSIFFLLGVMLGCYVGLSYVPSAAKKEEMSTGESKNELRSGSQSEEISHIERLYMHAKIVAKLQNTSLENTITCDKDGPEYVVEDKHSEMKHILAPLNLYFSKHQKYPLLLVHKNYRLNFSKSFFRDNTTRFQLSNGDSFAKKYEFHHNVELTEGNEVKDKLILFDLDQQESLQKMLKLAESKPFGFLLYSSLTECSAEYSKEIHPFLNSLAQKYKVFIEILSCDTEKNLKKLMKADGELISDGKKLQMSLFSQTKNEIREFTNTMVTFYGSKDPDYMVLVGANRCNDKGTERWLTLLKLVSQSLYKTKTNEEWVPLRSIKFVSWSQFGVHQFIKMYKEAWKQKLLVYIDLDEDDHNQMYVSSSIQDFAVDIAEELSSDYPKFPLIKIHRNNTNEPHLGNCEILEEYMGVPCVKIPKWPVLKETSENTNANKVDETDEMILKFFANIMLSMADGKLLKISISHTVGELEKELNENFKMFGFSFNKNKFETIINSEIKKLREFIPKLLRISKSFQKSLEVMYNNLHESYEVRKTNDLILRLESGLRMIIHHVKKISSAIESQLSDNTNLGLVRHAFEADYMLFNLTECGLNDFVKYEILTAVRGISKKIQGLARLLNFMEWAEFKLDD